MMKKPRCLPQKDDDDVKIDDYLSQLPDELICEILSQSQLTVFDAYRTRLLSRRWANKLWLFSYTTAPNLIFSHDYMELWIPLKTFVIKGSKREYWPFSLVHGKRHLFAALLTKVLMSYHQPLLHDFVINFYLNSTCSGFIDECISFAFRKGVKRLQLDLSPHIPFPKWEKPYAFPSTLPPGIHNNLTDVSLKHMKIRQKSVDALLCACPLLEHLCLQPENRVSLKITGGPTLKLKHLDLHVHHYDELILISAPNLISLSFKGRVCCLHLLRVPLLSDFCVGGYLTPFIERIDRLYSYYSQLKNLKLIFSQIVRGGIISYPTSLPQFPELQQLEVTVKGHYVHSFLWLTLLIKASPLLRRFSVESTIFCLAESENMEKRSYSKSDRRRIKKATKFGHHSLKEVEMRAFKGLSCEIELLQHLFHIGAQSLENAVIDTRLLFRNKVEPTSEPMRKLARSLGKGLDSRVHFVVL